MAASRRVVASVGDMVELVWRGMVMWRGDVTWKHGWSGGVAWVNEDDGRIDEAREGAAMPDVGGQSNVPNAREVEGPRGDIRIPIPSDNEQRYRVYGVSWTGRPRLRGSTRGSLSPCPYI